MRWVLIMILFVMTGCATLNPISALTDTPKLEVNAQIAKNAEQDKSVVKVESGKTEQKADTISNDVKYTADTVQQISNQMPMWMFATVMILAGWAIPTPKECLLGLGIVLNGAGKVVAAPFKGVANFILMLFGRETL